MANKLRAHQVAAIMITVAACLASTAGVAKLALKKQVITAGGGAMQGGPYNLTGSIGQSTAHPLMSAATADVSGGFWSAEVERSGIFQDGFE